MMRRMSASGAYRAYDEHHRGTMSVLLPGCGCPCSAIVLRWKAS
ncbi:hypothetical protein A2U01_0089295, partial [Trifolium medium]|nr:hypothetical protein [Trifolium medium]